jgi:multisubunit Na+/H+ antiporter MnhB subunit
VTAPVLADIAWWGPILIVVGALLGLVVAYALLLVLGGRAPSRLSRRVGYEATEKTNYPSVNLAAFAVVFVAVALIVGLAIGLAAD